MKTLTCLVLQVLAGGLLITESVAGTVFPLKVSPSNRYLVDDAGAPFLIQADSGWDIMSGPNQSDLIQYLDDRKSKGFNTLIVELIEHKYQAAANPYQPPTNNYGQPPFLTPGDFSTPNEAYFTNADWVIDQAAARGMAIVLFPCFVGYPASGQGWYDEMLANGTNQCWQYGQYVGNRYKDKPNIIWAMYGDHDPQAGDGPSIQPAVEALMGGIKSVDTNHLFTVHLQRNHDVRTTLQGDTSWLQLNTDYSDMLTYKGSLIAYTQTAVMPFFMIESYYEGEHGSSPASLRAQAYWANLSGACGQTFGNGRVWGFFSGWQSSLDSVGANDMTRVATLFLSRPWTNLVPDSAHQVVTAGYGTLGNLDYVTAALASDGATMIAYLPAGGTVTVDLSQLSGAQAQAWWYNPRNGEAFDAGIFATAGTWNFTAADSSDWVLVIDDTSRLFPPPGSTVTSLQIVSSLLPAGGQGAPYAAQLIANGGTTPYSWSVISGALAPGLSLATNGLISGTPAAAGAFGFTVGVTDASSATVTQAFALTVNGVAPAGRLVAAYSFNEGTGLTATDSSGCGNNGTLDGAVWFGGKFGGALAFDGMSQVTVPDSPSLDLTEGMTLEAWVYPLETPSSWTTVVMKEQGAGLVYTLYAGSPENQPSTWIFTTGENGFSAPTTLPLAEWSHLAATYDGTNLCLYVNGLKAGSQVIPGGMVVSSHNLSIGGNGIWGEYFTGMIDEVRVYSRALTAGEIQSDMINPVGTSPILSIQSLGGDALRVTILGASGYTYQVQSTTDLASGSWETVGVVTADFFGNAFYDTAITPEARFFRTVYP